MAFQWLFLFTILAAVVCFPSSVADPGPGRPTPSPSPLPSASRQAPTPPPLSLCSPLADEALAELSRLISDPYAPPPGHSDARHQGVDFSFFRRKNRLSIRGEGIQSVLPGTVRAVTQDKFPFGYMVMIETPASLLPAAWIKTLGLDQGESLYALYAHMQGPPLVKVDEAVDACSALGRVGSSGNAAVAHLHFETRLGPAGTAFNSIGFYKPDITSQERHMYTLWATSGVYRHMDPMRLLQIIKAQK